MKTGLLFFACLFFVSFASAQVSVSASYNYTLYKGGFQRNVPGIQLRAASAWSGKQALFLSYTHGFPITETSMINAYGNNENLAVNSRIRYKLKTYNLGFYAPFVGSNETKFTLHLLMGLEYAVVDYDEKATEAYDQGRYPYASEKSDGRENGVFGNLAVGGGYKIGLLTLFGEGGYSYPVGATDDQFMSTDVPPHIIFNTGVRINLGR